MKLTICTLLAVAGVCYGMPGLIPTPYNPENTCDLREALRQYDSCSREFPEDHPSYGEFWDNIVDRTKKSRLSTLTNDETWPYIEDFLQSERTFGDNSEWQNQAEEDAVNQIVKLMKDAKDALPGLSDLESSNQLVFPPLENAADFCSHTLEQSECIANVESDEQCDELLDRLMQKLIMAFVKEDQAKVRNVQRFMKPITWSFVKKMTNEGSCYLCQEDGSFINKMFSQLSDLKRQGETDPNNPGAQMELAIRAMSAAAKCQSGSMSMMGITSMERMTQSQFCEIMDMSVCLVKEMIQVPAGEPNVLADLTAWSLGSIFDCPNIVTSVPPECLLE